MGVTFDEDQTRSVYQGPKKPKMTQFIIGLGLAKNETQAVYILFGLVGVLILISLFAIFSGSSDVELSPDDPALIDPIL